MACLFTLLVEKMGKRWQTTWAWFKLKTVKGSVIWWASYILHPELFCFMAFDGCLHCNDGTSAHGQVASRCVCVIQRHSARDHVHFLFHLTSWEILWNWCHDAMNIYIIPALCFLRGYCNLQFDRCRDVEIITESLNGNTFSVVSNTSLIESSFSLIPTP